MAKGAKRGVKQETKEKIVSHAAEYGIECAGTDDGLRQAIRSVNEITGKIARTAKALGVSPLTVMRILHPGRYKNVYISRNKKRNGDKIVTLKDKLRDKERYCQNCGIKLPKNPVVTSNYEVLTRTCEQCWAWHFKRAEYNVALEMHHYSDCEYAPEQFLK